MSESAQAAQVDEVGEELAVDDHHQYLTFYLAGEIYAVDILQVEEIRGWNGATRVPNQPPHVKGVVNLRGAIVPVLDLRDRFALSRQDYTEDTVVIVLRFEEPSGGASRVMGVIVDAVSDVVDATPRDVSSTPDFGSRLDTRFICGLATVADSMVMLLDVAALLGEERKLAGDHD